jgi:2'-5' RNA ligase
VTEAKPPQAETLRLFFALWPDDATRNTLHHTGKWLHKHWGGRAMRRDTLHLTLAFLGRTPAERLDALTACVDSIRAEAFTLNLDQPGCWPHHRIGWLGTGQTPPRYVELVAALNAALQAAGFPVDARPHVPHVTLLRNTAGGGKPACNPVHWPVGEFVLVASLTEPEGANYAVIRRWDLKGVGQDVV